MQLIQAKRVAIRSSMRRQQLQTMFANKRRLMMLSQCCQQQDFHLTQISANILKGVNYDHNINLMGNRLSIENPFENWQQHIISTEQFCYNLCIIVLQKIVTVFKGESKTDINRRIGCLTITSNLLADERCPNHLLYPKICDFLRLVYYSIEIWGVDKQIKEVGWMIGNLIGKNILLNIEQHQISYIFEWIEELIQINDSQMVSILYKSLPRFINSLQDHYNLKPHELPQLFKTQIINIINLTIQNNMSQNKSPKTAQFSIMFLIQIYPLVQFYCPHQLIQLLVKNTIYTFGCISKNLFNAAYNLLQKCIRSQVYYSQNSQKRVYNSNRIRYFIINNYSTKLLSLICLKQLDMKVKLLEVIIKLINEDNQAESILARFMNLGLEEFMINIVQSKHEGIIFTCFDIANFAIKIGAGRLCSKFILATEHLQEGRLLQHQLQTQEDEVI